MKAKDLTGRKFGGLTALSPTAKRDYKGSVIWRCICECGRETEVSSDSLKNGNCKSCGCWKREMQSTVSQKLHLVDGTCLEWLEKRRYRRDNTSGFRGVSVVGEGRYRVHIGFKGRQFYVGTYPSFEQAVRARICTENLIHGGFLKAYRDWQNKAAQDPEWAQTHPLVYEVRKEDGRLKVVTLP